MANISVVRLDHCPRCHCGIVETEAQITNCPQCQDIEDEDILDYKEDAGGVEKISEKKYRYSYGLTISIKNGGAMLYSNIIFASHPLYEEAKLVGEGEKVNFKGWIDPDDNKVELIAVEKL